MSIEELFRSRLDFPQQFVPPGRATLGLLELAISVRDVRGQFRTALLDQAAIEDLHQNLLLLQRQAAGSLRMSAKGGVFSIIVTCMQTARVICGGRAARIYPKHISCAGAASRHRRMAAVKCATGSARIRGLLLSAAPPRPLFPLEIGPAEGL